MGNKDKYDWSKSPLVTNESRTFCVRHDLLEKYEQEISACSTGDIWISIESTKGELKRLDDKNIYNVVHHFVKQTFT